MVLQLFVVVSCRFDYQQRILKTFPDPGYFSSLAGIVWIWHLLVNFHVYCWTFYLAIAQTLQSWCSQRTMVVWSLSVTAVGLVLAEDAKNVSKHISTPRMGTCNIYIYLLVTQDENTASILRQVKILSKTSILFYIISIA